MRLPYRSRERLLTGVAAGVADWLGVDPWLMRALWLVSVPVTLFGSAVLYVGLAIALPVAAEGHLPSGRGNVARPLAALLLAAHGLIHVIGFAVPWRLMTFGDDPYRTTALWGTIELGDAGMRLMALVWLGVVAAFLVAAAGLWRNDRWAVPVTAATAAVSAVICALGSPAAILGLATDVAILAAIVAAPAFAGRPRPWQPR